jgi:thiamine-phosphate pyrophosphorylase
MIRGVDLSLMLVTDPTMTTGRGLIDTVRAAVAGGVTIVQLRDKQATDARLTDAAMALHALLLPLGVPLIINDRSAVAKAMGAAGAHIGQNDGDPRAARTLLGANALVGLSVTSRSDIPTIDPDVIDYAGVGPVFTSPTKADAAPALGAAELAAIGARLPVPFIAIGGIDAGNAAGMIRAGAAGVAVVSAICAADDPRAAARAIRNAIERAR